MHGWFNRASGVHRNALLFDASRDATSEKVAENFPEITDLSDKQAREKNWSPKGRVWNP